MNQGVTVFKVCTCAKEGAVNCCSSNLDTCSSAINCVPIHSFLQSKGEVLLCYFQAWALYSRHTYVSCCQNVCTWCHIIDVSGMLRVKVAACAPCGCFMHPAHLVPQLSCAWARLAWFHPYDLSLTVRYGCTWGAKEPTLFASWFIQMNHLQHVTPFER